ncbi:hypothetical protein ACVRWB_05455 [Streptococcus troglodytae]
MTYNQPDAKGFYGNFGSQFVPRNTDALMVSKIRFKLSLNSVK